MTGGQTVGMTQANYAVDRKSLEATSDHPSNWTVVPAQGLTVSFPIGSQQQDYTGWVSDTQTTTPLKYVRQETRDWLPASWRVSSTSNRSRTMRTKYRIWPVEQIAVRPLNCYRKSSPSGRRYTRCLQVPLTVGDTAIVRWGSLCD